MSNRNWSLATIIGQMYDPRPSSAWFTMLGMMASYARGNEAAQNRLIAYELGVSERQVRRWRNEHVIPNRYQDQLYFASKLTRFLSPIRRSGTRALYPVGFLVSINEYAAGLSYAELKSLYDETDREINHLVSPPPRVKPPALIASQRGIQAAAGDAEGQESGRMSLVYEYAASPNVEIPVKVVRVSRKKEKIYYESIQGYLDFFNPYDLPLMGARVDIAIRMIASHPGAESAIMRALSHLYALLRVEYGFYSPGNTRLPNASVNRTVSFMRWFERVLNMIGG